MYMPRMRARQHEVLAVRHCASVLTAPGVVVPIMEPVSMPNSIFVQRMRDIAAAGMACDLVLNPSVGDLRRADGWRQLGDFYREHKLLGPHGLAILSNADSDHGAMREWIDGLAGDGDVTVDVVHERDLSTTLTGATYHKVRWNIAEDRTIPAAYGLPLSGQPVVWSSDPFPSLARNREYVGRGECIFSTRVSGFESAGYLGLSDFLTIGGRFQSGGGPAYAVVIHLTYYLNNVVRLHHFCSDSNDTQDDPAGKFLEALEKLISFVELHSLPANPAVDYFRRLYSTQHFPGLGKVKEISMMNHIFVMHDAVRPSSG